MGGTSLGWEAGSVTCRFGGRTRFRFLHGPGSKDGPRSPLSALRSAFYGEGLGRFRIAHAFSLPLAWKLMGSFASGRGCAVPKNK